VGDPLAKEVVSRNKRRNKRAKLQVPVNVDAAPAPIAEAPPPEPPRPEPQQPQPASSAPPRKPDLETVVDLDSASNFYTGLSQNISGGGLFVATTRRQRIGDRLHVQFTLPGVTDPIGAETEVRWTRSEATTDADHPPGIGVRFLQLSVDATRAITAFMERRDSIFFDDE
jgi:uncharacterized protein (TIGR02266 family)